jgi:hypothetical protein
MEKASKIVTIEEPLIIASARRAWNYTIGFLRLHSNETAEDATLLGSGVLVKINGIRAILTAQHVVKVLPRQGKIGLALSNKKETSNIDASFLNIVEIERGNSDETGPDLAYIILAAHDANNIESKKSFYNLSLKKEQFSSAPPEEGAGIWFALGFVDEKTKIDENIRNPATVKSFCQFSSIGKIEAYETIGEYDYYNFPIDRKISQGVPEDYGGTSGGGLWQVTYRRNEFEDLEIADVILRGICFYQLPSLKEKTGIRCHGYNSIYEVAFEYISQHAP